MIRVESVGSLWLIDDERQRYMRMPKEEQPRVDDRDFLTDLVWFPLDEWSIGACPHRAGRDTLHIKPTGDTRRGHICAPIERDAVITVGQPR